MGWRASGFCSDTSPEAASDTGVGQVEFEGDKEKKKKKGKFPEVFLLPECLDKTPSQFKTHPFLFSFKYSEIINNNNKE